MIERVIGRLKAAGVTEVVVNLFHLADQIVDFLASKDHFGIRIAYSREADLLDTGGGLKQAAWFFDDGRPFLLHNVDILSEIDFGALVRFHEDAQALATLAVQARTSSRRLLFDRDGRLRGRETRAGTEWATGPVAAVDRLGFSGIHVISPAIFPLMTETGSFSIMQSYLRLAGTGARILAFRADGTYWQDVGSAEKLAQARRLFPSQTSR
jgi:NDP-sugar pyrophosphorylase family protein